MNPHESLKGKMTAAVTAIMRASVTPILMTNGQEARQQGTGVFFQIGEHKLMVTAAHVLEGLLKEDWEPFLLDAGDAYEPINSAQLVGRIGMAPDPFDVAITLLDQRTRDNLPRMKYLTLSDVEVGTVFPGAFVLGGFPTALGMESQQPNQISGAVICSKLYTGPTSIIENFDPQWHILIDRMEEDGSTDSDGNTTALPDSLIGASGSPLFQTYRNGTPFPDWTPSDVRVIGVATEDRRQAITATRWAAVLVCAYNLFPEVRSEIEAMGLEPNRIQMPAVIFS